MQRLYFALFCCFPFFLQAQVIVKDVDINQLELEYIEVWDNFNEASKVFNAMIDYGQRDDIEKDKKGNELKVMDGKKFMAFNSSMEILNFMYDNGWEMAYVKKISRFEESYIMKKARLNHVATVPVKFDEESMQSIKDLNKKAKKQRTTSGKTQTKSQVKKSTPGKTRTKKLVRKKVIKKASGKQPAKEKMQDEAQTSSRKKQMEKLENQASNHTTQTVAGKQKTTVSGMPDLDGVHVVNGGRGDASFDNNMNTDSGTTKISGTTKPVLSSTVPTSSTTVVASPPAQSNSVYWGQSLSSPAQSRPVTTYQKSYPVREVSREEQHQKALEIEETLEFLMWKAKKERESSEVMKNEGW